MFGRELSLQFVTRAVASCPALDLSSATEHDLLTTVSACVLRTPTEYEGFGTVLHWLSMGSVSAVKPYADSPRLVQYIVRHRAGDRHGPVGLA